MIKQAMVESSKLPKYDEFFTPPYAVTPLLPYLPRDTIWWEPTDTDGKSGIASTLRVHGLNVISTSCDFFDIQPPAGVTGIITNPPYSLKDEFLRRCDELEMPFALLMPVTALEGVQRGDLYRKYGIDIMVLDRRVEFTGKSVWFNTSWFTYKILPSTLVFSRLKKQ
jgi:hypothetical protein